MLEVVGMVDRAAMGEHHKAGMAVDPAGVLNWVIATGEVVDLSSCLVRPFQCWMERVGFLTDNGRP